MTFEELARIVDQGMHKAFVEAEARERARKKAGLRVVKPPKSA